MWKCPKCGRDFSRQKQDHYCVKPNTIDEYIAAQNEDVQVQLNHIRTILQNAIPDAEERISWSMPTYWKGRNILHFAASKNHIGFYPGDEAVLSLLTNWMSFTSAKERYASVFDEILDTLSGIAGKISVRHGSLLYHSSSICTKSRKRI